MFVLKSKLETIKEEFEEFKSKILGNVVVNKDLKNIYDYKFPDIVLERTRKDLNVGNAKLQYIKIDFF